MALKLDSLNQKNLDLENQEDTNAEANNLQNDDQLDTSTSVEDPTATEMTEGEDVVDTGDTSTSVEDPTAMEITGGEDVVDTGDTSTPVEDLTAMEMTGGEGTAGEDASTPSDSDAFDQQILDLVNQERAKVGADPLSINEQLDQAADLHSQDQAGMNNSTHMGSNGSDFTARIGDAGYQYSTAAENVAAGQIDAADVMASWMGSDGHRANILNADFEDIGIGSATGDDGSIYWTQNFGAEIT